MTIYSSKYKNLLKIFIVSFIINRKINVYVAVFWLRITNPQHHTIKKNRFFPKTKSPKFKNFPNLLSKSKERIKIENKKSVNQFLIYTFSIFLKITSTFFKKHYAGFTVTCPPIAFRTFIIVEN